MSALSKRPEIPKLHTGQSRACATFPQHRNYYSQTRFFCPGLLFGHESLTTSFIDQSTEAGILLGGNDAPCRSHSRSLVRSSTHSSCYSCTAPYHPTHLTAHSFDRSLYPHPRLSPLSALALESLFSNEVDDVALLSRIRSSSFGEDLAASSDSIALPVHHSIVHTGAVWLIADLGYLGQLRQWC